MKSQKMKTVFVIVCLVIIVMGIVSLLTPSKKDDDASNASEPKAQEEATAPESSEAEKSTEAAAGTESEKPTVPEVEHRTGEEIIGVSDKDISDLHIVFYDSVNNDVTGNWRLAVISEDVEIQDYIFSYYQEYIKSEDEIHGIVNLGRNVTARINMIGGWLMVSEYDYVEGEEHDAKLLYSGTPIQSYIVYTDNGDVEVGE